MQNDWFATLNPTRWAMQNRRSLPSLAPRHTVHPVHNRSLPSLAPRHTVHPVHKKARTSRAFMSMDGRYAAKSQGGGATNAHG
jgi:hypothetical protein